MLIYIDLTSLDKFGVIDPDLGVSLIINNNLQVLLIRSQLCHPPQRQVVSVVNMYPMLDIWESIRILIATNYGESPTTKKATMKWMPTNEY